MNALWSEIITFLSYEAAVLCYARMGRTTILLERRERRHFCSAISNVSSNANPSTSRQLIVN